MLSQFCCHQDWRPLFITQWLCNEMLKTSMNGSAVSLPGRRRTGVSLTYHTQQLPQQSGTVVRNHAPFPKNTESRKSFSVKRDDTLDDICHFLRCYADGWLLLFAELAETGSQELFTEAKSVIDIVLDRPFTAPVRNAGQCPVHLPIHTDFGLNFLSLTLISCRLTCLPQERLKLRKER